MAERTPPPNGHEPERPDEEHDLLDQDALDALIAENSAGSSASGSVPPDEDAGKSENGGDDMGELLSQDDLDALIAQNNPGGAGATKPAQEAGQESAPVADEATEGEGPSLLDQAELDALISAQRESAQQGTAMDRFADKAPPQDAHEDAEPPSELLEQAELDALIASGAAGESNDSGESVPDLLDQDELDALVAGREDAKEAAGKASEKETRDEAGPEQRAAASETSDDVEEAMDQDALDALVASSNKLEAEVSEGGDDFLANVLDQDEPLFTQEELDELLAEHSETAETPNGEEVFSEGDPDNLIEAPAQALSEEELDDALKAEEEDEALTAPMDEALQTAKPADLTSQDDIDAILAGEDDEGLGAQEWEEQPAEPEEEPAADEEDGLLSQELLDALLSEAKEEETQAEPAAQEASAPPGAEVDVPRPEELAQEAEPIVEPAGPSPPHKRRFRKPVLPALRFLKGGPPRNAVKIMGSLAAGLIAAVGAYYALSSIEGGAPDLRGGGETAATGLAEAIDRARKALGEERYPEAVRGLSRGLADAGTADPLRYEAEYLRLEAIRAATEGKPDRQDAVVAEIDRVTENWPGDHRAPVMLHWKAEMLEAEGQTRLAMNVYRDVIESTPSSQDIDPILLDAGRLALELGRPDETLAFAQRLLGAAPDSVYAPAARLLLSEAQDRLGGRRAARLQLEQVAEGAPDSIASVEAQIRLARLDLDEGRPQAAVERLEKLIFSTTTTEGVDDAYLALAEAYGRMGAFEDAESILRDLLQFFAGSPRVPEAYVALTQVLDAQGKRREAAQIALQASQRYPESSAVMRNLARMRAKQDDDLGAAQALMAAEEAGANDPQLLMDAAQHFRAAGRPQEALQVYDALALRYPDAPQAFMGLVQRAEAVFELGRPRDAIEELEDLAALSRDRPRRILPLQSLARVYDRLGLQKKANEAYRRLAGLTTDPAVVAEAATVLLRNNAVNEGLQAAARVKPSELPPQRAYPLLWEEGRALLQREPRRGVDLMAEAQERYPEQGAPQETNELIRALLAAGQPAKARVRVEELTRRMRSQPEWALPARRANLLWGDYLYERGNYEAAAGAYETARRAGPRHDEDGQWAHYQYASALLEAGDLTGAIPLLDEVALSVSSWAPYAKAKAEAGRTLQRLRGLPVVPRPETIQLAEETSTS